MSKNDYPGIDHSINKRNILRFDIRSEATFKCVICSDKCVISNSYSNRGDHLICSHCYRKYFKNYFEFDKWSGGSK